MKRLIALADGYLEYELVSKNVKNLNLRVGSDGRVMVSAPFHVKLEEVDAFVMGHVEMILRAQNKIRTSGVGREFCLGEGGVIPVFGRKRRLAVCQGKAIAATLYEERLELTVPDPRSEDQIRTALRRELGFLAEKTMPVLCHAAAQRMIGFEIPKPTLRYRCMVAKWGSCCPSKEEIVFNKFLVCAPPECMEYVAVHEMAHFLVCDHSPEFHHLMDDLMPDWRTRKKLLEPYGYLLRCL